MPSTSPSPTLQPAPQPLGSYLVSSTFLAFSGIAPGLSGRRFHNKDPSSLAAFTTFLSHRIASLRFFLLLLLVAPPQSLARLPLRLLCLLVFFFVFLGFFGQLLVYRLPPGPGGRFSCIYPQILYYLVSPCPLISGWPSYLAGPVVVWFWLCALQYTHAMDQICVGARRRRLPKSVPMFGFGPWWPFF